jgi:hypothetical protein
MWTYHAERLVTGEPSAVHLAIADLVAMLWDNHSRTVLDTAEERLVAIAPDVRSGEADVWLTWRTAIRRGGTWVELQLDELEPGPDPTEALDTLLDTLADRLRQPPAIAAP